MNLQHLRHFVAVAQELHFGRAAERVGIAQPPLSQSIRRLESSLGCQLFKRSRRKVELTPAGEALLQHAPDILNQVDYARVAALKATEAGVTQLTIGFTPNALSDSVPAAMRAIRQIAPMVEISLFEGNTGEQVQRLLSGELDIGFFHPPSLDIKGLEVRVAERNSIIVAIPEDWPLAKKETVWLKDVAEQDLLMFPRHYRPDFHATIIDAFRKAGATPRITQEAAFDDTRLKLVAAGMGVSLVNERSAPRGYGGIAFRPIEDMPREISSVLACAWRRSASQALWRLFTAAHDAIRRV